MANAMAAARKDSHGGMNLTVSGSKPMFVGGSSRDMRRESLAGSMAGGMSWGGISVGSFIRDE